MVDPIDGTVNYLYEIPAYAVSIAARVGDEVVAGAVVNPVSGEVWTAVRGEGAWLDGRRLRLAEPPALEMALVATGFGYDPRRRARQAEVLQVVLPLVRDVRRAGAASLDLCAVAYRPGRRLLRAGPAALGPRGRRPGRPGGRAPW